MNAESNEYNIAYNKKDGQPNVIVQINLYLKHCLLNTGARMNVMVSSVIKIIYGVKLKQH